MFYNLLPVEGLFLGMALFRYITFRTIAAFLTAFLVVFFIGPVVIRWLRQHQKNGQPIREDGPQSHLETKKGTPTMGGVLILVGFLSASLFWADVLNPYVLWLTLLTLAFGVIGGLDDFLKLHYQNHAGLRPTLKFLAQWGVALIAALILFFLLPLNERDALHFPILKHVVWHLGWLFPIFVIFVIAGAANAVNLTDGLDGLAVGPSVIAIGVFLIIAYATGHSVFAPYLQIPYIPKVGELAVLCGALIGACLGFLWYNAPPASIFMGDTGSLAIGAFLGGLAAACKHEIILAFVGGVFVIETISVVIQVVYYKRTKKRIFLMAPIHHHFEKKGWAEPTIVFRFWTIAIILGMIGLASLKLR